MLRQLALNPLLLAVAIGFGIAALGGLPAGLAPTVQTLGRASVALGLLCVGAALSLQSFSDRVGVQAATGVLKLVVMPAVTWALCIALGVPPLATAVAVVFMALPTAATSYVMARAMGGDAPLMAAITHDEHIASIVTLPLLGGAGGACSRGAAPRAPRRGTVSPGPADYRPSSRGSVRHVGEDLGAMGASTPAGVSCAKPSTRQPAATPARTPGTLSSTTTQSRGAASQAAAAAR